jgi:hypothetical protein
VHYPFKNKIKKFITNCYYTKKKKKTIKNCHVYCHYVHGDPRKKKKKKPSSWALCTAQYFLKNASHGYCTSLCMYNNPSLHTVMDYTILYLYGNLNNILRKKNHKRLLLYKNRSKNINTYIKRYNNHTNHRK